MRLHRSAAVADMTADVAIEHNAKGSIRFGTRDVATINTGSCP
jgi:hypothetical protein